MTAGVNEATVDGEVADEVEDELVDGDGVNCIVGGVTSGNVGRLSSGTLPSVTVIHVEDDEGALSVV